MNDYLLSALKQLVWSLPNLVVYGVGTWVSVRNRGRDPRLSRLFTVAFALFAASALLLPFARAWMGMQTSGPIHDKVRIAEIYGVASGLIGLMHFAGWAVLLFAINQAFQAKTASGEV